MTVVLRLASEGRQIGAALVLSGRIQSTQANDQIAQGGQILGSVAGPDGGTVFAEGDVAHVVQVVFDAPVTAATKLELHGVHPLDRAAAEHDFHLLGDGEGFEVMGGTNHDGRLRGVRETGLFRGDREGIDLPGQFLVCSNYPKRRFTMPG